MATSNVNTGSNLTADVYGINNYVNEMQKRFNPAMNDETSMLGIFGYTGQILSDIYQNSIVMASEFSNESIPTKAKFEKNIIAHALSLGITDINATPAQMDVLLTFVETDISSWANSSSTWEFIFDKDTDIYIGDYCFHTDYDIQINKVAIGNTTKSERYAYTARYIIDVDNPVSDVVNPYLAPPINIVSNGTSVISVKCTLRQVSKTTIHKKILSDNSIASKTTTFDFEGQLAAFDIDVTEGDNTVHLVPVYDGLTSDNKKYPYFNYTYVDSNTIRIKFDRYSYAPRINSDLEIHIWTTDGESGNFTYVPEAYPVFSFESDKYGYSSIGCEVRPITGDSLYGSNKKSIDDLKELIPKESTSRGSITNLTDLENYFNSINTDDSVLYLFKKRDNALSRLYYAFIIMRDALGNVIPTNTIDLKIRPEQLMPNDTASKFVLQKGQIIKLTNGFGELYNADDPNLLSDGEEYQFNYVIPYTFIINKKPLYGMYYLSIMDTKKFLDFSYINDKCLYQYIATSVNLYRGYIEHPDTYEITINAEQNIGVVNEESADIKCLAVFYVKDPITGDDIPSRWASANKISFNPSTNTFTYRFTFKTDDVIDADNMIHITEGMHRTGSSEESDAYLDGNAKCVIHFVSKQGDEYGLNGLDSIIPDLEGYTLSNSYSVTEGIDFFYDYSDIISSVVTAERDSSSGDEYFVIKDVPCVKSDYFNTEDKVIDFCKELVKRKNYINYAIDILEDAFGMDFKFVNTYGPATLFTIDNKYTLIDRTNLSLRFRTKINPGYDASVLDDIKYSIKEYIESINNISSLHIPNLITYITNNYRDYLLYFEFLGINDYNTGVQHMYYMGMPESVRVPEFLNINTLNDGTPDIQIMEE